MRWSRHLISTKSSQSESNASWENEELRPVKLAMPAGLNADKSIRHLQFITRQNFGSSFFCPLRKGPGQTPFRFFRIYSNRVSRIILEEFTGSPGNLPLCGAHSAAAMKSARSNRDHRAKSLNPQNRQSKSDPLQHPRSPLHRPRLPAR